MSGVVAIKRAFRAVVSTVCSFEALFVLYLFAGRFKGDPRFQWVPVDLTALFFGLSVAAGICVLARRGFRVRREAFVLVLLALAFAAYVVASLVWTPSQVYARQKALYISTLTLWPLIACAVIIAQDQRRLVRFLVLVLLFSGWIAIESTMVYLRASFHWFIYALGSGYLGLGRVVGLGASIVLAYGLFFAQRPLQKAAASVLFGYYVFVLLILGGRGPFLAALLGASVPLLTGVRLSPSNGVFLRRYTIPLLWIGVAGVGVATYLYTTGAATMTLGRLFALFRSVSEGSAGVRLWGFTNAIALWFKAPLFGQGIGAFPVLVGNIDQRLYPHNLILEILAELGVVGLFLYGAMLSYVFWALGPLSLIRRDPFRMLILMLFVNVFVNAMVSGDIPDNRLLFGILGLMTLPRREGNG